MKSDKQRALKIIHELPDNVPMTDIVQRLYHVIAINQRLRRTAEARSEAPAYTLKTFSLGRPHLPDLNKISEVLAFGEGDDHR